MTKELFDQLKSLEDMCCHVCRLGNHVLLVHHLSELAFCEHYDNTLIKEIWICRACEDQGIREFREWTNGHPNGCPTSSSIGNGSLAEYVPLTQHGA